METHIFRVIVRGRFADLSDDDRQRLNDEHDPTRLPRFTEAGDFTARRSARLLHVPDPAPSARRDGRRSG